MKDRATPPASIDVFLAKRNAFAHGSAAQSGTLQRSALALLALALLTAVACSSSSKPAKAPPLAPAATAAAQQPAAPTPGPATTAMPAAAAGTVSPTPTVAAPRTPRPAAAAPRASTPTTSATAGLDKHYAPARALLLTAVQLPPPANWREVPADTAPNPLDRCDPGAYPGEVGSATSGNFSRNGDDIATITEEVALFQAPADVTAGMDDYPAVITCAIGVINAGALDDTSATLTNAKATRRQVPRIGDRTDGYRITFHVTAKGQSGPGSEVDGYLDLIIIQSGRAGIALRAGNLGASFDSATLLSAATSAEAQVRQGLR